MSLLDRPVSPQARSRAEKFLRQQGTAAQQALGEPPPLLTVRLELRRKAHDLMLVSRAGLLLAVLAVAGALGPRLGSTGPDADRLIRNFALGAAGTIAILSMTKFWAYRRLRRQEQAVAAELPVRVTHPAPADLPQLADRRWVAALVNGAVTLVVLALAVATVPPLRSLPVLAAVLAVLGTASALNAAELRHHLRRPVIAGDPTTLAVDDLLRAHDVRKALDDAQTGLGVLCVLILAQPAGWATPLAAALAVTLLGTWWWTRLGPLPVARAASRPTAPSA